MRIAMILAFLMSIPAYAALNTPDEALKIISAKTNMRYSLVHVKALADHKRHLSKKKATLSAFELARLARTNGLCLESDMPSHEFFMTDYQNAQQWDSIPLERAQKIIAKTHDQLKKRQFFTQKAQPIVYFRNVSPAVYLKIVEEAHPSDVMYQLIEESCSGDKMDMAD